MFKNNSILLDERIIRQASKVNETDENRLFYILNLITWIDSYALYENIVIRKHRRQDYSHYESPILHDFLKSKNVTIVGTPDTEFKSEDGQNENWIKKIELFTQIERLLNNQKEENSNYNLIDSDINIDVIDDMYYCQRNELSVVFENSNYNKKTIELINKINYQNNYLLQKEYTRISKNLKSEISKLTLYNTQRKIFIPPISALVFEKAKSEKDIFKAAEEIRYNFSDLRKTFSEYELKLKDDSLSIKESLNALNELESITSNINSKYPKGSIANISEWRDLGILLKLIDGISVDDLSSLTSLFLGKPLKYLAYNLKKRKAKYLFEMVDNFLNIQNYGSLIQRTFKFDINEIHIKRCKITK